MTDAILDAHYDVLSAQIISNMNTLVCPVARIFFKSLPMLYLERLPTYWLPSANLSLFNFLYILLICHNLEPMYRKCRRFWFYFFAVFFISTSSMNILNLLLSKPIGFASSRYHLLFSFICVIFVSVFGQIPQPLLSILNLADCILFVVSIGNAFKLAIRFPNLTFFGAMLISIIQTLSPCFFMAIAEGLTFNHYEWRTLILETPKALMASVAWMLYYRSRCNFSSLSWDKLVLALSAVRLIWVILEQIITYSIRSRNKSSTRSKVTPPKNSGKNKIE